MQLIDQHTKRIMEGCKERALAAGLRFQEETLEYIVTNRDLLELSPKLMIPTLYDYWVHDVEVLKEKGKYELYPGNPYETVINTRPAISFYNDNNPDWLNVMIFYHVLAHIDFFQNNLFFRRTWDDDFTGQALADKRVIARLRAERGRWVDYVIEFARGIDNLVGYHDDLARLDRAIQPRTAARMDYYFDVFLQSVRPVKTSAYIEEIARYNRCAAESPVNGEDVFFADVERRYPEFGSLYHKYRQHPAPGRQDLLQHIMAHSGFLNREENRWMKTVMEVVRQTALFFQPQIRTKIMNEGWASYWHEKLFLQDERISGHEVDYARVNAGVTAVPRVGLNPYALGMRLFQHIEELAAKGRYTFGFQRLRDTRARERYDDHRGGGQAFIFQVRENGSDFTFINSFVDQAFIDRHRLFVAGKRLDRGRMVWQYYVKSREVRDYRQMLIEALYHPPHVTVAPQPGPDGALQLVHRFEGKPLVTDFIANTLLGIEYLWGAPVSLETSEVVPAEAAAAGEAGASPLAAPREEAPPVPLAWQRVRYTMKSRTLRREVLDQAAAA
jgi:stage V sporulation protein R